MKLLLAAPRGFCAGVVRAIETVEQALALWGAPLYVRHEIVHNRHVVKRLKSFGAIFVEELSQVPRGSRVVYSAHGVAPSVREEAKRLGLIEIDATCGLVTKVHSAAKRFVERGYQVVLVGHRRHVEIIGIRGEAEEAIHVVESVEEVEKLSFSEKDRLAYLTQTTLSLDDVQEIVGALKRRFPSIETLPTSSICYATQNRQAAIRQIGQRADLVLVIGDVKSSNSNRLREVAERMGKRAYLIGGRDDLQRVWLEGVSVIAMTAGASTPEEIVQGCVARLCEWGVESVEEVETVREEVLFGLPKEITRHKAGACLESISS